MFELQKASFFKRASACLLDIMLMIILVTVLGASAAKLLRFDDRLNGYNTLYEEYCYSYGINPNITEEEYNSLTDNEKQFYEFSKRAIQQNQEVIDAQIGIFNSLLVIIASSIFLAHLILEFLVPLLFRNGQTVGKKIFAIGLVRIDCVKVSPFQLFVRSIVGKCAIETMVPVLLLAMLVMGLMGSMALIVIGLFWILQIVLFFVSQTNSPIHDNLAVTVVVDVSSQMIYDTPEALLEAKKQVAAEEAQEKPY